MPSYVLCEIDCIVYLVFCNVYHCPTNPCTYIYIYIYIYILWSTFCIMDNFYSTKSRTLKNSFFGRFHKFGVLLFKLSNQENCSRGHFHNIVTWILDQNEKKKKRKKRKKTQQQQKQKTKNCPSAARFDFYSCIYSFLVQVNKLKTCNWFPTINHF